MEKVRVVKEVPGMLKVGDVLTCYITGGDFVLEEKNENNERFVSIDYVTVSNNVPDYFEFEVELVEVPQFCDGCYECTCGDTVTDVRRSDAEIEARREFFQRQLNDSVPGSESEVVFQNLIWFIEWLVGEKELLK
jgi:hypothetical protein